MRSALLIFFLLVAAFVQGLERIDAQAAQTARHTIDRLIDSQR